MTRLLPLVLAGCAGLGAWQPVEVTGGLLFLEVEDASGGLVRSLVDTGAAGTVCHSELPTPELLLIGDRELPVGPVAADPGFDSFFEDFGEPFGPIDCLLGWSSLSAEPFTVDYAGARLRSSPHGHSRRELPEGLQDPIEVPLAFDQPLAMVDARVHELPALLAVDTGAQIAVVDPPLLDALAEPPATDPAWVSTVDGLVAGEFGRLQTLTWGGITDTEVDFVSYDSEQLQAFVDGGWPVRGIVGASSLVRGVVTFDGQRGRLTVQRYDRGTQQEQVDAIRDQVDGTDLRVGPP